ncbi:DUF2169 domain-containing protein [Paracoccus sp. M683]|uniref:DUF2169 family type VI secretion system accessory protein n=1 Tax=Paracoccus sp. M683 TaxID=2594268 RepID=UPI00117E822E|nr:DUF2169 domain-containing protein [Paracoccus sp. M683]TRW95370.1 DUF2169 domain-containing protein [Paracoccus sp. M683]
MKTTSTLPLSHISFPHWHTDDSEVGVVVAKAAFVLSTDGARVTRPPALDMADLFEGDPATSALSREQDIAPFKPRTDLTIRGSARSFDNAARRDWPVSISIPDRLSYGFHVRGPSRWHKTGSRWQLGQPELATEVPLTYALAYGGSTRQGDQVVFFDQNPAGQGFMTEVAARDLDGWPAPQIGLLAEFAAAQPFTPMAVHGTMPLAKGWLPRRASAGTFDAAWERNRHPRMPLDYDLGFWNAAPLRLQIAPHLQGDETLLLRGVSHLHETLTLALPKVGLALQSHPTGDAIPMVLDTVDIDVATIDQGHATVTMLWRALVADRDAFFPAEIVRG